MDEWTISSSEYPKSTFACRNVLVPMCYNKTFYLVI